MNTNTSVLEKFQPCGCVICTCETDDQCIGCGAKHCGKYAIGQFPEGGLWKFPADNSSKSLIQTTIRKLGYLLRDYPDDKETRKLIDEWKSFPSAQQPKNALGYVIPTCIDDLMGGTSTRKDEAIATVVTDSVSIGAPTPSPASDQRGEISVVDELLPDWFEPFCKWYKKNFSFEYSGIADEDIALERCWQAATTTPKPVLSNLQQERDFLFDLAVSKDANRICDRDEKINFDEQLVRSKSHVKYLLKGAK